MKEITFDRETARSTIKKKIIQHNLIPYKCACGNEGQWNGKRLTLQLDHINGDRRDNNLTNLRFLCPNCHSQEPTSNRRKGGSTTIANSVDKIVGLARQGKNIRTILIALGMHEGSGMYAIIRRILKENSIEILPGDEPNERGERPYMWKVPRPTKEEFAALLDEMPLTHLTKRFGVSMGTLQRWCKSFGLKAKSQGYWNRRVNHEQSEVERAVRKSRRSEWPSKEELEKAVWEMPTEKLQERYRVSDVAIAKWCQALGVAKPKRGYWARRSAGQTHEEAIQPMPPKHSQEPSLTDDQVRLIRAALAEGKESYRRIAKRIGCHHTTVSAIHKGKRFAHVL